MLLLVIDIVFYTIHQLRNLPFNERLRLDFKIMLFDDVLNVGVTAITHFQNITIKNLMVFVALGKRLGNLGEYFTKICFRYLFVFPSVLSIDVSKSY